MVGRKLFQGQVEGFSRQGGNIFVVRWKENQGKIRAKNERRKEIQGKKPAFFLKWRGSHGDSWVFLAVICPKNVGICT